MRFQENLDRLAVSFDRKRDALVVIRPFRHGETDVHLQRAFDPETMADRDVRRLISNKFVTVIKDGRAVASILAASLALTPTPVVVEPVFACDVAGCGKSYSTKLKLASHNKAHRD